MKAFTIGLACALATLPAAAQQTAPASPAATPAQAPLVALPALAQELNPTETALVVVDFQNAFAAKDGEHYNQLLKQYERTGMIEHSVNLVKQARALGIQVIQVTEAYTQDYRELDHANGGQFHRAQLLRQAWKEGSYGAGLWSGIAPGPGDNDIVLPNRMTMSAFGSNGLDYILKSKGIRNVAIIGYTIDLCVLASSINAYDLGYRVFTMNDTLVADDEAAAREIFRYEYPRISRIMASDDFLRMFHTKS